MSTFQDRQQSLLLELSAAERQAGRAAGRPGAGAVETWAGVGAGELDRRAYRRLRGEMRQFRGRESIFKRPEAPLSRCLRSSAAPGRLRDPRKWLHYSLEDVSAEDMSDATNTATALALLRELEHRALAGAEGKDALMICDDPDRGAEFRKPTFCASATIKKVRSDPNPPKVQFRSSKVVMPEYVVGKCERKPRKKIARKEGDESKRVELKLDHLFEED